jgi:hypothetical protein
MSHCSSRARAQASLLGETPPKKSGIHAIGGRYNTRLTSTFIDTPVCLKARMWSRCYLKFVLRASSMGTVTLLGCPDAMKLFDGSNKISPNTVPGKKLCTVVFAHWMNRWSTLTWYKGLNS